MASSIMSKTTCNSDACKNIGILKCEGCSQIFCRKHVLEHRDVLSHHLDEVILEHDTLQQIITEETKNQKNSHPLIEKVNEWERNSIMKIQQTANEARKQIEKLISSKNVTTSKELHEISNQLKAARLDDSFVEGDLFKWMETLTKLKNDVTDIWCSINVREDLSKPLVSKLILSSNTEQKSELNEQFQDYVGTVCIKENGRLVYHNGPKKGSAFVRGCQKYSSGVHEIRFVMDKKNSKYVMSFNIVPASISELAEEFDVTESCYGWFSDDISYSCGGIQVPSTAEFYDMQGETMLEITLVIDCDNRKISYFNERTKNRREMNVNTTKCALPWKLLFSLFDVEDSIRILSSKTID